MGNIFGPTEADYSNAEQHLVGPDKSNYQIPGAAGIQQAYDGYRNISNDPSQANSDYARQGQTADMLYQQALGKGPSVANEQMKQGLDQAQKQIQSSALTNQAGLSPGLTQRNILNAQSGMDSNVIGQSGLLRANEQLGALGQLGGLTSSMRSGSQQGQAIQNNAAATNQAAREQNINDKARFAQTQTDNNTGYDKALRDSGQNMYTATMNRAGANAQQFNNGLGTIGKLAGGIAPLLTLGSN